MSYTYPATVNIPAGKGKTEPAEFTARFRLVPSAELESARSDDAKFLAQVLVGWEGVSDHTGKVLPFNASNRDKLAGIGYFALGVLQAYSNFALGLPAKNSAPPPAI